MPSSELLPTPAPAKMPMRWPSARVRHAVDGAHPRRERPLDGAAQQRVDGALVERLEVLEARRREPVEGAAESVDDAAEELVADGRLGGPADAADRRTDLQALRRPEGHQEGPRAPHPDHLRLDRGPVRRAQAVQVTDGRAEAPRLEHEPDGFRQGSVHARRRRPAGRREIAVHRRAHASGSLRCSSRTASRIASKRPPRVPSTRSSPARATAPSPSREGSSSTVTSASP
jgi:hypothetical protein